MKKQSWQTLAAFHSENCIKHWWDFDETGDSDKLYWQIHAVFVDFQMLKEQENSDIVLWMEMSPSLHLY